MTITQTLIREDDISKKPYTEYVMLVEVGAKKWTVSWKYKMFCSLHEKLSTHYPSVNFPASANQFQNKSLTDIMRNKKNALIEDWWKLLQLYINDVA